MNKLFWKSKKVLITGHTGFKGSWLSLWLQKLGSIVTGYSLPPPTKPSLFDLADIKKGMNSIKGDIRDFDCLLSTIKKERPEIILHLAAQPIVNFSYENPIETYTTNVMGVVNLLESVRRTEGVRAIINVTSDKCYENKEWVWGYRENEPMGGFDPYSSSKSCSELVTSSFRNSYFQPKEYKHHGVAIASARAGNVIGGGDWANSRLVPDCMKSWLAGKTVTIRYPDAYRPWQHVLEPLNGYLQLAEKLYEDGLNFSGAWNFGPLDFNWNTVEYVILKLGTLWNGPSRWEKDPSIQPHEAHFLKLDSSKANTMLKWSPIWNIDISLKNTAEWYLNYQEKPKSMQEITLKQIENYSKEILDA